MPRIKTSRSQIVGPASAIVHDTADPENLGRVKLRFPWFDDTYVTDWVRVVEPYGLCPCERPSGVAVGHEVLVNFVHGDIRDPVVIGRLRNAKD